MSSPISTLPTTPSFSPFLHHPHPHHPPFKNHTITCPSSIQLYQPLFCTPYSLISPNLPSLPFPNYRHFPITLFLIAHFLQSSFVHLSHFPVTPFLHCSTTHTIPITPFLVTHNCHHSQFPMTTSALFVIAISHLFDGFSQFPRYPFIIPPTPSPNIPITPIFSFLHQNYSHITLFPNPTFPHCSNPLISPIPTLPSFPLLLQILHHPHFFLHPIPLTLTPFPSHISPILYHPQSQITPFSRS